MIELSNNKDCFAPFTAVGTTLPLYREPLLPKISSVNKIDWSKIDVVFLSLPNGEAQKLVAEKMIYAHLKFIDLSADFRFNNRKNYEKWYKTKHKAVKLIKNSLYSIPELSKSKIKKFRIIGNPGCYPTSIILPSRKPIALFFKIVPSPI